MVSNSSVLVVSWLLSKKPKFILKAPVKRKFIDGLCFGYRGCSCSFFQFLRVNPFCNVNTVHAKKIFVEYFFFEFIILPIDKKIICLVHFS